MTGFRLFVTGILACLALVAQPAARISRDRFMKAVEIGGMSADDLAGLIRNHGVDFQLSDEEKRTLSGKGVDPVVLRAVAESHRPGEAPQPRPAAVPAPVPSEAPVAPAVRPSVEAEGGDIVVGKPPAGASTPLNAGPGAPKRTAGLRAIAIIVHRDNPLSTIDSATLRRIYMGEMTVWRNGRNIYVINRDASTPARKAFYKRVLKADPNRVFYLPGLSMVFRAPVQEPGSTVRGMVSRIADAVGYVDLNEVDSTVKVLAVNGVMPSEEAIANRTYPLLTEE